MKGMPWSGKPLSFSTQTGIPLSTVERCLSELRKERRVKYVGSKRYGGYHVVAAGSRRKGD